MNIEIGGRVVFNERKKRIESIELIERLRLLFNIESMPINIFTGPISTEPTDFILFPRSFIFQSENDRRRLEFGQR